MPTTRGKFHAEIDKGIQQTDDNGGNGTSQRYNAWGEVRPGPGNGLPTNYTFTGQQTVESIGLMFYNARWYGEALADRDANPFIRRGLMRYHPLGRTGLQISEIGFGGAPAGLQNYLRKWDPNHPDSEESIVKAIVKAFELGINYYDTAPGYGDGASERMFGRAIHPFRDQVYIATKASATKKDDILRSIETSLERLQVEIIDVMQIHGTWYNDDQVQEILGPNGALEGLQKLRSQGLIKFLGFTTEGVNGAASHLIASGEFDVIQCCYNLIYQHPYDPIRKAGLIFEAEDKGMGIVTMRPLTSGIFQKWFRHVFSEEMQDKGNRQRLHQALLSFVLSNPMVDSVLVGMRTAAEVIENIAVCENQNLRIELDRLHERFVT